MKINIKKTLKGWVPDDGESLKYHLKGSIGDIYHMDVSKFKNQRNAKLNRKYWVMLGVAVKNTTKYRTTEDLHHDIKWGLDYVEYRQDLRTGKTYKRVKSTSFESMEDIEFNRFFSDAVNIIIKYIIPETNEYDLMEVVNEIIGFA